MRVFFVEDAEFRGTFFPLSHLRFDATSDWYVGRDDCTVAAESLRDLNISLDDIRFITKPTFSEFDEVRSWTPVSAKDQLMERCVAFGPNDDVALVVRRGEDGIVETMHFHVWHLNDRSVIPQIVQLLQRIATRWDILLETLNTQQVATQDASVLTAYVDELLAGG